MPSLRAFLSLALLISGENFYLGSGRSNPIATAIFNGQALSIESFSWRPLVSPTRSKVGRWRGLLVGPLADSKWQAWNQRRHESAIWSISGRQPVVFRIFSGPDRRPWDLDNEPISQIASRGTQVQFKTFSHSGDGSSAALKARKASGEILPREAIRAVVKALAGSENDYLPLNVYLQNYIENPKNNPRRRGQRFHPITRLSDVQVDLWLCKEGEFSYVIQVHVLSPNNPPATFAFNVGRDTKDAAMAVDRTFYPLEQQFNQNPHFGVEPFCGVEWVDIQTQTGMSAIPVLVTEWRNGDELHVPAEDGRWHRWRDQRSDHSVPLSKRSSRHIWNKIIRQQILFSDWIQTTPQMALFRLNAGDFIAPERFAHRGLGTVWTEAVKIPSDAWILLNSLMIHAVKPTKIIWNPHLNQSLDVVRSAVFQKVRQAGQGRKARLPGLWEFTQTERYMEMFSADTLRLAYVLKQNPEPFLSLHHLDEAFFLRSGGMDALDRVIALLEDKDRPWWPSWSLSRLILRAA